MIPGTVIPPGFVVAVVLTLVFWILTTRSVYGFSVRTVGAAPSAARYGGFDASRTVWSTLMISGGMAGLAGILEAMSQLGQINLGFPSGYGFTAIIVSFLGRLHPIGVLLAGLILAVTYVGGQVAQTAVHVPQATAGIFQATMLFFILASDILVRYRLRFVRGAPVAKTSRSGGVSMTLAFIIDALITVVGVTTPILLAATGELVAEKSGVINLGVEGMMLIGAITAFAVAFDFGPDLGDAAPWVAVIAAALAGAASSMLFAVLALTLGSNQVATGLALTIFGIGLSSLIGAGYVGMTVPAFDSFFPDWLTGDPVGRVVFGYSPLVYFALVHGVCGRLVSQPHARWTGAARGRRERHFRSFDRLSCAPDPLRRDRLRRRARRHCGVVFFHGHHPMWAEQMTAGRGWIALALVVFSGWRAGRLLLGAYFFGILMTLELYAKASGFSFLPSQFWAAMPYIMAVVVLAVISARGVAGSEAPSCLGRPFMPNA